MSSIKFITTLWTYSAWEGIIKIVCNVTYKWMIQKQVVAPRKRMTTRPTVNSAGYDPGVYTRVLFC